eukprot:SAG22_NODE_934_length_6428_cov_3.928267_4_plen_148_part_00
MRQRSSLFTAFHCLFTAFVCLSLRFNCANKGPLLAGAGQCKRGGGCDESNIYLERHDGWSDFNLDGETPQFGAQKELLRRRQAFFVRQIKEATDPELWAALEAAHPDLLKECPTPGRQIRWQEISAAQYPMFGAAVSICCPPPFHSY